MFRPRASSPALAMLIALSVGGCTQTSQRFPSLLPRAVENDSRAAPDTAPAVAAPDPALERELAELSGKGDTVLARFDTTADNAERAARTARGADAGSAKWLVAQVALAELDPIRIDLSDLAAQLEQRALDRAVAGEPPYPALDAAVKAAREHEQAAIARISAIEGSLAPA